MEAQAVAGAVAAQLDSLDGAFLEALTGYAAAARARNSPETARARPQRVASGPPPCLLGAAARERRTERSLQPTRGY